MEMPPLPAPFRERLLPTEADAVDAATAEAIRAFCDASPEIEVAYVCAVERTRETDAPARAIRLSVKLAARVETSEDSREASRRLVERFSRSHPDVMLRLGFGVLTDRGVPAFERYGLKLFDRSPIS